MRTLRTHHWDVQPLEIETAESSYFANESLFPWHVMAAACRVRQSQTRAVQRPYGFGNLSPAFSHDCHSAVMSKYMRRSDPSGSSTVISS
jgi:hypothetical protein